MIELRNLSHGFLKKDLFSNVSLRLLKNERYGIVGANGCGKSTLLKIIAKEIDPDGGEVFIEPFLSLFRIGQDHNLDDDVSIIDTAMMGQMDVFGALKKQEEIEKGLKDIAPLEVIKIEELLQQKDGYRLKSKARSILCGLGIDDDLHDKPLKVLSGGYKWRCYLAKVLLKSPNILLLDEPTNHLDIISIRWLEIFLSNYDGCVLLVSHDKRFMDNVCTQIMDIDFGTIKQYAGNYTKFEKSRGLFLLQKEKEILSQRKEIDKKLAFIERFRYKASKARQAQSRLKQIERIVIEEPTVSSRIHPKFIFNFKDQGSKEVLEVKNLSKSFDEKKIINNFSFQIKRGEKIAIVGANGSGKSTIVKALAGEYSECQSAIKWGMGVNFGYFPQDAGKLVKEEEKSALEWLWQFCPEETQGSVQSILGRVLFSGTDANKSVNNLSGGELSRLYLAKIMMQKPNVLLLDEPTNHLDLETIESLEIALENFKGTLLMVSHDRDFVQKIAMRIIEVSQNEIIDHLGTYEDFVFKKDRDYLDASKEHKIYKDENKTEKIKINTYEENKKKKSAIQKINKELEKIIIESENIEREIKNIDEEFLKTDFFIKNSHEKILHMQKEKEILTKTLTEIILKWENLERELAVLS